MSTITFHRSHTTMDSNGRKFAIPRKAKAYCHSRPINSCLSKPASPLPTPRKSVYHTLLRTETSTRWELQLSAPPSTTFPSQPIETRPLIIKSQKLSSKAKNFPSSPCSRGSMVAKPNRIGFSYVVRWKCHLRLSRGL